MNLLKLFSILMLSLFLITSCSDDENIVEDSNSIVDIAANDARFSTLVGALQRTGLDQVLAGAGTFTVFAPTNDAFANLGVDLNSLTDQELSNILLYHVLTATVPSSAIQQGQTYVSTASESGPSNASLSMLIELNNSGVTINGNINVITPDINADNGVIHVVDNVILPLDIVGHASANTNFSRLTSSLSIAPGELVSLLSGTGPYTVFAPINSAFDAISDVVATLTQDQLAQVLTYHVIMDANVRSSDLSDGATVAAANGQNITIDLSNGPRLIDAGGNASNIIVTDVQATNGIIHAIESVIIPEL